MSRSPDAATIAGELAGCVDSFCLEFLPKGRLRGHEWVDAHRAEGGLGDSMRVNIRTGIWGHFAAGKGGDALDLAAYVLFAGDKRAAMRWARGWLGLEAVDPKTVTMTRAAAAARQAAASI